MKRKAPLPDAARPRVHGFDRIGGWVLLAYILLRMFPFGGSWYNLESPGLIVWLPSGDQGLLPVEVVGDRELMPVECWAHSYESGKLGGTYLVSEEFVLARCLDWENLGGGFWERPSILYVTSEFFLADGHVRDSAWWLFDGAPSSEGLGSLVEATQRELEGQGHPSGHRVYYLSFLDNVRLCLACPQGAIQKRLWQGIAYRVNYLAGCYPPEGGLWACLALLCRCCCGLAAEVLIPFAVLSYFISRRLARRHGLGLWVLALIPLGVLFAGQSQAFWFALDWLVHRGRETTRTQFLIPASMFAGWMLLHLRLSCWPRMLCSRIPTRVVFALGGACLLLINWVLYHLESPLASSTLWASVPGGLICLLFASRPDLLPLGGASTAPTAANAASFTAGGLPAGS